MEIRTVDCKNVKCYLVKSATGYLMFDAGWPHQYTLWKDSVRSLGIGVKEISHIIVSHFHIDHAGLAGLLVSNGKDFTVFENQVKYIDEMETFIAKNGYPYRRIDRKMIKTCSFAASRDWLSSIGIEGEVVQTFGHGDQGIALLLDSGEALIGDLPAEYEYDNLVKADWDNLKEKGAKYIYPAHAEFREIEQII